jgi:hypothetical protein
MKRNKTLKNNRRRNKKLKQRRRKTYKGGAMRMVGSKISTAGKVVVDEGLRKLEGTLGTIFGRRMGSTSGPPGPGGLGGQGDSAPAPTPAGFTPSVSAAVNLRAPAGLSGPSGSGAPFSSVRTGNASGTASRLTRALPSAPIQARLPRAPLRPGRRYSLEEAQSMSTTNQIHIPQSGRFYMCVLCFTEV